MDAFRRQPAELLSAGAVTLAETLQAFALAAVAGILLGTALAASEVVARAMYPALVALNAVPKLAFGPLLVWLGFGAGDAGADTALSFAAISLLAVLSIILFYALALLQRHLAPWVRHTTA